MQKACKNPLLHWLVLLFYSRRLVGLCLYVSLSLCLSVGLYALSI
jgi:hypothetical protein